FRGVDSGDRAVLICWPESGYRASGILSPHVELNVTGAQPAIDSADVSLESILPPRLGRNRRVTGVDVEGIRVGPKSPFATPSGFEQDRALAQAVPPLLSVLESADVGDQIVDQSRHHATSSTIVRVIAERFVINAVSFRVVVNTYDPITVGRIYDRSAISVPSDCFSVSVRRIAGDGFDATPRTVSVTAAPP